jgi:Tfp pilus assembly protein PilO
VFDSVEVVRNMEERFEILRRSAACATLSQEQVSELIAITANLIEERKRIRAVLNRLPERFGEVRQLLNELNRTVR